MKLFGLIISVVFFAFPTSCGFMVANAQEDDGELFENQIKETLETIDLSEVGKYYEEMELDAFYNGESLEDVVYNLILGEETFGIQSILDAVFLTIKASTSSVLKLAVGLILIIAAASIGKLGKNSSNSIINYFIVVLILGFVASIIASSIVETVDMITKIKTFMELICPILLALLVSVGASSSSAAYSPAIVLLTGAIVEIVVTVLISIVVLYFILCVLSSLNGSIKLEGMKKFLLASFKWILGLVFTIFIAYLSINGITAASKDGISIKTAKFAIKSYLPLVGGYVSDSYEIFRAGSALIKNAIGTIGVIILFAIIIKKVLGFIIYNSSIKLVVGISEPFAGKEISSFLSSLSNVFSYLIACVVAVFMMSFITILVMISTANLL